MEILVQAWKTLGEDILTDDQIRQVIERIDNRDMQLCWHYDESRSYWWVGKGLDESTATKAYTYRRSRELDCEEPFPNEQWNAFISAVQDIVDESSTTRIAHDIALAYEKNTFDKFQPRKRYDLTDPGLDHGRFPSGYGYGDLPAQDSRICPTISLPRQGRNPLPRGYNRYG